MNFESDMPYLKGELFNDDHQIHIINEPLMTRFELLEKLIRDKNVIDLGFADHKELIAERIDSGIWFHDKLCSLAKRCLGVDINQDAVDFIKNEYMVIMMYYAETLQQELRKSLMNIGIISF